MQTPGDSIVSDLRMRLVYLDTSQIIALDAAQSGGSAGFARFIQAWRRVGAILAFSRVHVVELRRHADSTVRASRLALLRQLLPLRTDAASTLSVPRSPVTMPRPLSMGEREILHTLTTRSGAGTDVKAYTDAFPTTLSSEHEPDVFAVYEREQFGGLIDLVHEAVQGAVESRAWTPEVPYKRIKLRDLTDKCISADDLAAQERPIDAAIRDEGALARLGTSLPPGEVKKMVHAELDQLRRFYRRQSEIGVRAAYAEACGVIDMDAAGDRYLDDLTQEHIFRQEAAAVARDFLNKSPEAARLAASVPLETCPGRWLHHNVDLETKKAESNPIASNAYDLDHLVYMPYVDLFFADKRTTTYVEAVLRRPGVPESIAGLRRPVKVAQSATAIAEVIERELLDPPMVSDGKGI